MLTFPLVMGLGLMLPAADDGNQPADAEKAAAAAIQKLIGVEFAVVESKIRRNMIRTKTPYGFKISKVEKESIAAKAGWKAGDMLMEWDGQPVKKLEDLEAAITKAKGGVAVKFKLSRYKTDVTIWSRQPWQDVEGKLEVK